MKKFTIIFFCLIAAFLVVFFVINTFLKINSSEVVRSKVIVPISNTQTDDTETPESFTTEDIINTSLLSLNIDETLITTISIDFNEDSFEDQIIAVKKANNQDIVLIVAIYNINSGNYERAMEIQTPIFQVKTFSMMAMDLTGNHQNDLIVNGFSVNNESILQAYMPIKKDNKFTTLKIADLITDGTIFIQQTPRSDNYTLFNTNADSFPIWMYSTEENENDQGFDQIQVLYNWNEKEQLYQEVSSTRIPSKKIAAKELARIQDGTIPTFQNFLDGLWYRTSNTTGSSRYLFFNPNDKEIIFFYDTTQEVYTWINSTLRRNGIYISAANKSISNLVRYFDIALVSIDEIRIRVSDDVRMLIGEDTLWDGVYKKKTEKNSILSESSKTIDNTDINSILEENSGKWTFLSNTVVFADKSFVLTIDNEKISGVYTDFNLFETNFLQFRSNNKKCKLNGYYLYKIQTDKIELIPVKITTDNYIIEGTGTPIKLEHYIE